jgi:hypothetical protein
MAAAGSTFSATRMASVLASAQITITATRPRTASPDSSSTYFGKTGAQNGGGHLADDEADQAQAHRLLQDHAGDRAVARADQLEHRDLADLAQRHRVDDEGDDGGADDGQDHQEHADLPRPRWRSAWPPGSPPSATRV